MTHVGYCGGLNPSGFAVVPYAYVSKTNELVIARDSFDDDGEVITESCLTLGNPQTLQSSGFFEVRRFASFRKTGRVR